MKMRLRQLVAGIFLFLGVANAHVSIADSGQAVYDPTADPRYLERGTEPTPRAETIAVLAVQFGAGIPEGEPAARGSQPIVQQSPAYLGADPAAAAGESAIYPASPPVYGNPWFGGFPVPVFREPSPRIPWWSLIRPIRR